ncbi:MAG: hypothetical protein ACOZBH_02430 [Patescibacteria group bacterium]
MRKRKKELDTFILNKRQEFINKYGKDQIIFPKFKWQHRFHDHRVRDENDLADKMEYIDINPSKHGIVKPGERYKYCSTHYKYDFIDELPF